MLTITFFGIYLFISGLKAFTLFQSHSGELQKLRSHPLRTQSSKVLPLKPAVGQYTAMPRSCLPSRSFQLHFFFPNPLPTVFCVGCDQRRFLWAPQNKIGHPAGRHNCLLVSRCFEPCQPQRTASGIETKFSLFPSYS